MSRTLSQLSPGTIVWLYESVAGESVAVKYIYLGQNSAGNAILLREAGADRRAMSAANVASYNASAVDFYLENAQTGFLARFDANTLAAMQNTTISWKDYSQSTDGAVQLLSSARRCFLLSTYELGLEGPEGGTSFLPALKAWCNTSTANTARILLNSNGAAVPYWTRSAYDATHFIIISASGASASNLANRTENLIRPAISFASETPVSEADAEHIFLLPDSHQTFWQISFTASLGIPDKRPMMGKLFVPNELSANDTMTLKVCNNYADPEPTWISCENEGTARFGSQKTGTHWELGVKVDVQTSAPDRIVYEPAIIIETEAAG